MRRERMLLDRLAERGGSRGGGYQPSAVEDVDALMESVRRQLDRLLNARHDMSQTAPDYGLPALTDLTVGSGDYVQRVQNAIRKAIEKYEPRLRRVRVVQVKDDEKRQNVAFRVEAVLVSGTIQEAVCYETKVTGGGEFEVSE